MNCPNCGSSILPDQQFCRSCGAGLMDDEPRSVNPRLWGLMMVFAGIFTSLAGSLFNQRGIVFVGVFLLVAGMFFIAAYPMLRSLLPRKRSAAGNTQPESLAHAETTKKLAPVDDNSFIPSVTENTTNLLNDPAQNPVKVPR